MRELGKMLTGAKSVRFGLFGTGGFAREVMPLARDVLYQQLHDRGDLLVETVFVEKDPVNNEVNGYKVISEDQYYNEPCDIKLFNIAISDSRLRERLAVKAEGQGALPLQLISSDARIYDSNEIERGGVICAFSMVTSNAKIGKFFHSNIYSYVAHDCVIGDFVTFAPGVRCNGNVHIGNHAYVGTGAVLKHGSLLKPLIIGEGAVIGMGAIVTRDVPPNVTVVGNPAKPMAR